MVKTSKSKASASQLDVVLDGTWVIAPTVDANGVITGVNVYSPACGHPHGAFFTNQLNPSSWPQSPAFYMLDAHSHVLTIKSTSPPHHAMNISALDQTINHCVTTGRPIGGNWDLVISIASGPDSWVSGDTVVPTTTDQFGKTVSCFNGNDAPTGKVSSLQTLSFRNIKSVELLGAPSKVQGLLPAPWSGSGTLIFEGEVPYIPTLQHERDAISAMANLAGLDLVLNYPLPLSASTQSAKAPKSKKPRPMSKAGGFCGHSVIVLPTP